MSRRIGIYAGVFNPVHAGHIAFALQAMHEAKLDRLYFLPERRPQHKTGVEHFGHRVAMLKQATRPHAKFGVLELPDVSFTVKRTLPRLQQRFPKAQLVFLFGSDSASKLADWPNIEQLLNHSELIIGLRNQDQAADIQRIMQDLPSAPLNYALIDSYAPEVSSGKVREALYQRHAAEGLLRSVQRYSNRHWLYVSLADSVTGPR